MESLKERQITDRMTDNIVEIEGVRVKCVVSNIRRHDIPWNSYRLISGKANEGNLVIVEAKANHGFRVQIENQKGRDERIYKGDRFVAVVANRHSGTSESGDIPIGGIDITTGQDQPI